MRGDERGHTRSEARDLLALDLISIAFFQAVNQDIMDRYCTYTFAEFFGQAGKGMEMRCVI